MRMPTGYYWALSTEENEWRVVMAVEGLSWVLDGGYERKRTAYRKFRGPLNPTDKLLMSDDSGPPNAGERIAELVSQVKEIQQELITARNLIDKMFTRYNHLVEQIERTVALLKRDDDEGQP